MSFCHTNQSKGAQIRQQQTNHQSGNLLEFSNLSLSELQNIIKEKMKSVDFTLARKDVEPFLKDHSPLQIWSTEYFIQLVDFLIEK